MVCVVLCVCVCVDLQARTSKDIHAMVCYFIFDAIGEHGVT